MHSQINLIKFIESNRLDNVYSKIWHILFDQISLIKISKKKDVFYFIEKEPVKINIPTCEEKITKIKLQMNEHEISFQVNNSSWLQIVQLEFTI